VGGRGGSGKRLPANDCPSDAALGCSFSTLSRSPSPALQTFAQPSAFPWWRRSNQRQPPRYLILASDICGERRFASAVARRLEQLGALTQAGRPRAGRALWGWGAGGPGACLEG
jgi:hypothetical protein